MSSSTLEVLEAFDDTSTSITRDQANRFAHRHLNSCRDRLAYKVASGVSGTIRLGEASWSRYATCTVAPPLPTLPEEPDEEIGRGEAARRSGYTESLMLRFRNSLLYGPQVVVASLQGYAPARTPIVDREGQTHWHGDKVGQVMQLTTINRSGLTRAKYTRWRVPQDYWPDYYRLPPPDAFRYEEMARRYEKKWESQLSAMADVGATGIPVTADREAILLGGESRHMLLDKDARQAVANFLKEFGKIVEAAVGDS